MSAKNERLCIVSVGYIDLLLPQQVGIKLAGMLEGAVLVRRDFENLSTVWRVEREAEIEYRSVKAEHLRGARIDAAATSKKSRRQALAAPNGDDRSDG